jgi:hypothetical protein
MEGSLYDGQTLVDGWVLSRHRDHVLTLVVEDLLFSVNSGWVWTVPTYSTDVMTSANTATDGATRSRLP